MKHASFTSFWSCAAVALAAVTSGCASLQSVSVTQVPSDRSHVVRAHDNNVAFLGIHFDNSFADGLRDELKAKCPHGRVTGIFTKYESFSYFLFQRRKVSATGFCVDAPSPDARSVANDRARSTAADRPGDSS